MPGMPTERSLAAALQDSSTFSPGKGNAPAASVPRAAADAHDTTRSSKKRADKKPKKVSPSCGAGGGQKPTAVGVVAIAAGRIGTEKGEKVIGGIEEGNRGTNHEGMHVQAKNN